MLSHHKFLTIMGVLLSSLVLATFFLYLKTDRCSQDDEKYCAFLRTLDEETFEHTHGIFLTQQGAKESQVIWILADENKQIRVVSGTTETMNMIATEEQVYVKDYRDGLWWVQSRKDIEQYVVSLEFDPETFLTSVIHRLKDPNVRIRQLDTVPCGSAQCLRFNIGTKLETSSEYIDVEKGSNRLARYVGKRGEDTIAFNVHYETMAIAIPDNTKPAEKGQNIFLEQSLFTPEDVPAENLEYVQQFEQEMKETENGR